MTQNRTTPRAPRNQHRALMTSAAAVAIVAGGLAIGAQIPGMLRMDSATAAPLAVATSTQSAQSGFADLIATVSPAVVSVKVEMTQPVALQEGAPGRQGMPLPFPFGGPDSPFGPGQRPTVVGEGSGFFVTADGYAVTANHVVANAAAVELTTSDGKTYKAHVVGTDPATDVALMKVDGHNDFPYVQFADTAPRVGDWVVAIGNPYGLGNTATAGIVSATARAIDTSTLDNYLQIDAPINQGNSGGPTFDLSGHVVGINDAIYTPSGGSVGIGFDVPADIAKLVSTQLQKDGHVSRGWLGVQVQDVTQPIADSLGMKTAAGAIVTPQAGSPAARGGLTSGDVIVALDGKPIANARGLAQAVAALTPGTTVKLDVMHGGKTRTESVVLGSVPERPQNPPA